MKITDGEQIKKKLEKRRERLLRSLPEESRALVSNPDAGDLASRYDRLQRVKSLDNEIAMQLNKIEAALERLQQGSFGICRKCGRPISKARLEVLPQTPLCIECRHQHDKKHPHDRQ